MNIKQIIREEMDDFDWVRDTDPITRLDTYYKNLYDEDEVFKIFRELKLDYKALFGLIRQPNKIYWEITDVYHPVKELFSYEDFKNKNIREGIKNYYKNKITEFKKKHAITNPFYGMNTVYRFGTGDSGPR